MELYRSHPIYYEISKKFSGEIGKPIYKLVVEELELGEDDYLQELIKKAYQKERISTDYPVEFITKTLSHLYQ